MLRESRSLFQDLPEAACVIRVIDSAIVDWNRKADNLFRLSDSGRGTVLLTDCVQAWNTEKFREAFALRQFDSIELRGVTGLAQSGPPVQLDLLVSETEWRDEPAWLVLFAEASHRMRLEEQLRQAQKMESVGMLAGGIAHDFNNLLTIISGYSHMLTASLSHDEKNRFAAEQVIKASDRAAALTRQLLSFSRRQVAQLKALDLNGVVSGMEPMLRRIIGEQIELTVSSPHDLGRVRADASQVEQIVMNLVVNARDAMPEGGKLWIETRNAELDANYLGRHMEARPGPFVMLAVTDSGTGMNAETREKIFDPFFTTKAEGRGTGLGLSMVYGIVKRAGGTIDIYSELGHGTIVKVYLPRVESADPPTHADLAPDARAGSETVLLVEDEEAVRTVVRATLEAKGYRLLVAASGEEAVQLLKQHTGPISLLITDMVLPKMNGREIARRVHKRDPGIAVLFMSGYTDVVLNDVADPDRHVHFIGKPFTPIALSRHVREVLDAAAQRRAGAQNHGAN